MRLFDFFAGALVRWYGIDEAGPADMEALIRAFGSR
jgi:hypothetical protein